MILTSDYYISENPKRQLEYDFCIEKVLENKYIKKIVFFTNSEKNKHVHQKIEYVVRESRPTYNDFFQYFNLNYPNDIIVLSNLDIYFDDSIELIKQMDMNKNVLALTRYEYRNNNWVLFNDNYVAQASQDTWVFKTPINCSDMFCDFTLGIPGCDNRIAYEFTRVGYNVINNSLKIKTYHKHDSNHRTWQNNKLQPVPPPYHYIQPTF